MPRQSTSTSMLTAWRTKKHISLQKLGDHFGIDSTLIGDWERGVRMPRLEFAVELEAMSDGAVPIESFGYGPKIVRELIEFRSYLRAAEPVPERIKPAFLVSKPKPGRPKTSKPKIGRPKTTKRKAKPT